MKLLRLFCSTAVFTLLFTSCLLLPASLMAEERIAFIVGNDRYPTAPLENAVRDATAVRDMLRDQLGFKESAIHFSTNTDRLGFFESFEAFTKAAGAAEIVLFYYAGHGMESIDGRENFILPVDADVKRAAQSEAALRATGINLMTLSADLALRSNGAKVILMDACRERPAGRTVTKRSGGGLAVYEDKRIPADTLIMLAAAPERVASDGKDHGPFTEALLEVLPQGGQDLMDSFFAVSDRVQEMTQKQQVPWLKFDGSGKIFRTRHFLAVGTPGMVSPAPVKPKPLSAADRLRGSPKDSPFVNSLGMEFIPVPGKPGVYMCRTETRVRDFEAFVNATGYDATEFVRTLESGGWKQAGGSWRNPRFPSSSPQTGDHPVTCVSWEDARAFCAWLSKQSSEKGLTYRLPVDSEWSAAVGIGRYPWGGNYPPPRNAGNYPGREANIGAFKRNNFAIIESYDDGMPRTARVGSYGANRFGFYDLGGNVLEWCEDRYRASMNDVDVVAKYSSFRTEISDDGTPRRVGRGGSWNFIGDAFLRSATRHSVASTSRVDFGGFRCVVVVGG
ncbi:MAG: SUMF1/EgtB/PvdO family nonheme iron enzyme [Verrucomicrobiales bacterium]|nr:SUMF1/EgtB/PvdO family nonheme iron enzyme [Verrucomicrobiales bacterium]